jgi:hypothetical protein
MQYSLDEIERLSVTTKSLGDFREDIDRAYDHSIPTSIDRARASVLLWQLNTLRGDSSAVKYFTEASDLAECYQDPRLLSDTSYIRGVNAFRIADYTTANREFFLSIEHASSCGHHYRVATSSFMLGIIAQSYGAAESAIELWGRALVQADRHSFLLLLAQILSKLSETYLTAGNSASALKFAQLSHATAKRLQNMKSIVEASLRIATIELEEKKFDSVISNAKEAIANTVESNLLCTTHTLLGKVHAAKKEWKPAETELKAALSLATYPNAERVRSNIHCHLCEQYLARKKNDLALGEAQAALEDANTSQDVYCRKEALKLLQQCYKALGKFEEAYKYLEEYNALVAESDAALLKSRLEYHALKSDFEQEKANADMQTQQAELLRIKLEYKERELTEKMRHLVTQAEAVRQFRNDLRALLRRTPSDDPAAKDIRTRLSSFDEGDAQWQEFEAQFRDVHPEFRAKIIEKFPTLSKQEVKMCQLARLGLKTHEMARLLCLSERTIDGHRNNLRKKLGLAPSENLTKFLQSV